MIGASLNQYRITASIGAGGMGEVFRARDTRLNRDVAIKVLPKDFASDADRLRRFEQEAKTLAALNHPNVLTVHDAGVHEGAPYFVSELLEGETLREEMNGGALPVRKATDYALQIRADSRIAKPAPLTSPAACGFDFGDVDFSHVHYRCAA
ncbi:MAG: serine/threonine protein kinase [Verrucomicrobia bacterium]|nr:serine/threonine protein kinase [Verrucomicrobiota bacterium]